MLDRNINPELFFSFPKSGENFRYIDLYDKKVREIDQHIVEFMNNYIIAPQQFIDYLELDRIGNINVVGIFDHLEIWNPEDFGRWTIESRNRDIHSRIGL